VRAVTTGVTEPLVLEWAIRGPEVVSVRTTYDHGVRKGAVVVRCDGRSRPGGVTVRLSRNGRVLAERIWKRVTADQTCVLRIATPEPWWPNGHGDQVLYDLVVETAGPGGRPEPCLATKIGFKQVRWLPCEGAPVGARPLLCEVNGRPVFLQGVNWTPPRLDYASVRKKTYDRLVGLYQRMGCTLLRVWGGAYLERGWFYEACDRAGLLVWQEFPLSSSGVENDAPREPQVIRNLCCIARDYVRRRSHHASLLLWCGGNELQEKPVPGGPAPVSLDERHPALAALAQVVDQEDPGRRFLPTSPSGPVFYAAREEMGRGTLHHVHGPWDRASTDEAWEDYCRHDDALFRSETGVAGAQSLVLFDRYAGSAGGWPVSAAHPWWRHASSWWAQEGLFDRELQGLKGRRALARFISLSQARQARFLAAIARSCAARFPRCGGFLVWMGHDCFPCPANTSVIDFDLKPKPAYHALRRVFRATLAGVSR
jgi:beta-mannosidase